MARRLTDAGTDLAANLLVGRGHLQARRRAGAPAPDAPARATYSISKSDITWK